MDSQLALHLPAPRARRRDPDTSHGAARSMRDCAKRQAEIVLSALVEIGQAGAEQIAERVGLTQVQVCRRLPELEAAGQVELVRNPDGRPATRLTRTGRSERLWRAV